MLLLCLLPYRLLLRADVQAYTGASGLLNIRLSLTLNVKAHQYSLLTQLKEAK